MSKLDNKIKLMDTVNSFATEMQYKLSAKLEEGYTGWDDPSSLPTDYLEARLVVNLQNRDFVDVANLAMILWYRRRRDS